MAVKRKRVSKKKKISWRKHVNIDDVEEFLEDQRLQVRLGKSAETKTNAELFQLDVQPSKDEYQTKSLKRELLRKKIPKCYSVLRIQQEPDPVTLRTPSASELKKYQRRILRKIANKSPIKRTNGKSESNDLWSENAANELPAVSEWFGKNIEIHTLRGTGKIVKSTPKTITNKTSILPSVEAPHPGMSYNPSLVDHMNLLNSVAENESNIIKKEKHLKRVTKMMSNKVFEDEKDAIWLNEMSEGLVKDETETNDESDDIKQVNKLTKQKTRKQLRKRLENKKKEYELKLKKQNKKKIADIYKLRFINSKLTKDEQRHQLQQEKRVKKAELKSLQPKRLSAIKFQVEEVDLNVPGTISGNLRNIKEEGNLLLNRFKSLQKRNILQPTIPRQSKRGKIKRYIKPGYGSNWIVTVAKGRKITASSPDTQN